MTTTSRYLVTLAGAIVALRVVRALVWGPGRPPDNPVEAVVGAVGPVVWALPSLGCALGLIGILTFLHRPRQQPPTTTSTHFPRPVCFRVVSRGRNLDVLRSTVTTIRQEMAALPLFPYRIEVVSDFDVDLDDGDDLELFVVPAHYTTTQRSLFKARALQYAIEHSPLPDDTWLFHLDEESHITASVIAGIRDAIIQEEASGALRIGQGCILYHRSLDRHPVLTMADMIRTGDDLTRFRFQHALGFTVFGLHGSFVLVRNDIEKAADFDVGPEGSITEDAFWALRQMALGRRCRWVDGYIVEQPPETAKDFVRQRRRWFAGLIRVVLYAQTTVWIRLPLAIFVAVWSLSWFSILYTALNGVLGLRTPPLLAALGDFTLASYLSSYLLGLHTNLRHHATVPRPRRALLHVLQVVLLPVFSTLEAAGILAGFIRPERGFHVIRKETGDQAS